LGSKPPAWKRARWLMNGEGRLALRNQPEKE
jgi:hypothetical protein